MKNTGKYYSRNTKSKITLFLTLLLTINSLSAQDLNLRLNVAPSYSIIQDYSNTIFVGIDFVVPNLVIPSNSTYYRLFNNKTKPSSKLNFDFELELGLELNENLRLSVICGLDNVKYHYNTIVIIEGEPTVNLKDLDTNYGDYQISYFNFKPLNVSAKFFNDKLEILGGPSFNYLICKKHNDIVLFYETSYNLDENQAEQKLKKAYFETNGTLNNFLSGINFRLDYKINNKLDLYISSQYYFNSIFDGVDRHSFHLEATNEKVHLFQLQTGLGYELF